MIWWLICWLCGGYCSVVVERDQSEFARLSQLGDILGMTPIDVSSVHTEMAEQAYRQQVQSVRLSSTVKPLMLETVCAYRMRQCPQVC